MYSVNELMLNIAVNILCSIIAYYICKWLDGE
jgi:hypothetical protein